MEASTLLYSLFMASHLMVEGGPHSESYSITGSGNFSASSDSSETEPNASLYQDMHELPLSFSFSLFALQQPHTEKWSSISDPIPLTLSFASLYFITL